VTNFALVAVPLFILIAEVLMFSGASSDGFDFFSRWLGWLPGGLAVSTVWLSALFASVLGSSTGNTAIVGLVATPEMLKRGYNKSLATGCVAAGGALGVLIPPSILFILYGILAEVSIGKLFIGGIIPGLILTGLFSIYIIIRAAKNPDIAPSLKGVTWRERWASLWKVWAILGLALIMLIAIYGGFATPSEVAGIGALIAIIISLAYKRLKWSNLKPALLHTTRTTCMIIWILVAASSFGYVLTYLGLPQKLMEFIFRLGLPPIMIILGINFILFVLGCIMDPGAIILVTTPIFIPIIKQLGIDPLWFGVMFVVNMEMAEITPPFGFNLFVMKAVVPKDVTMGDIIRGAAPFIILQAIGLALVIIFPDLALWLPSTM
jgi:tripartite ATP-independent transporter DctM subunit